MPARRCTWLRLMLSTATLHLHFITAALTATTTKLGPRGTADSQMAAALPATALHTRTIGAAAAAAASTVYCILSSTRLPLFYTCCLFVCFVVVVLMWSTNEELHKSSFCKTGVCVRVSRQQRKRCKLRQLTSHENHQSHKAEATRQKEGQLASAGCTCSETS